VHASAQDLLSAYISLVSTDFLSRCFVVMNNFESTALKVKVLPTGANLQRSHTRLAVFAFFFIERCVVQSHMRHDFE
jgi:hypothetical protein